MLAFWSLEDIAEVADGPFLCMWGGKSKELVSFATPLALVSVVLENSTVEVLLLLLLLLLFLLFLLPQVPY
jgi:hypothetical protein